MSAAIVSRRLRGTRFRLLTALTIRDLAPEIAAQARADSMLAPSEYYSDGPEESDIHGLQSWAIHTRAERSRDLPEALRRAQEMAAADGKPNAAVAFYRNDDLDSRSTFIVMSLQDFVTGVLRPELERETAR